TTDQVVARYPLTGCKGSHGLLIDSENRLAFAACEENSKLVVFDLQTKKATATLSVGADPDVLAFDSGLHRLYVSAASGNITLFSVATQAQQPSTSINPQATSSPSPTPLSQDNKGTRRIHATRTTDTIKIDGMLDEAAWSLVQPATDFLQQQPNEGAPASERT